MITRKILLCMIALMAFAMETHAQWKAYLSYYEPKEIEQANDGMIYVLASGGLFSYSTQDQEVRTYDKTTLLSDCQISHIAWCKSAKKLVIAYDDYNIDLLSQNDDVVNIPAYMNTSMTVDKTINGLGCRMQLQPTFDAESVRQQRTTEHHDKRNVQQHARTKQLPALLPNLPQPRGNSHGPQSQGPRRHIHPFARRSRT